MESLLWKMNIKTFHYILCLFFKLLQNFQTSICKKKEQYNKLPRTHDEYFSNYQFMAKSYFLHFPTTLYWIIWYALQITLHACFSYLSIKHKNYSFSFFGHTTWLAESQSHLTEIKPGPWQWKPKNITSRPSRNSQNTEISFKNIPPLSLLTSNFSGGPAVRNLPCNAKDTSSIPGPGQSHRPWSN